MTLRDVLPRFASDDERHASDRDAELLGARMSNTIVRPFPVLLAGDVLLYRGMGLYGRIIQLKTWHPIGHVEVFIGNNESVASRNGVGVGQYAYSPKNLAYIMRSTRRKSLFDLDAAMRWFETVKGTPYGWSDLLQFIGVNVDGKGMVCSPFATLFMRNGGLNLFNAEPAIKIAPFQFLTSESLRTVWSA